MKRLLFAISCLALSAISGAQVAVISDDFNRPDGPVGNGWSVWNGSDITSGQLRTFGANGLGGGVYRPSTIGLLLKLSFDFRTESTSFQCGSGSFNDGG